MAINPDKLKRISRQKPSWDFGATFNAALIRHWATAWDCTKHLRRAGAQNTGGTRKKKNGETRRAFTFASGCPHKAAGRGTSPYDAANEKFSPLAKEQAFCDGRLKTSPAFSFPALSNWRWLRWKSEDQIAERFQDRQGVWDGTKHNPELFVGTERFFSGPAMRPTLFLAWDTGFGRS